jgi:hypothetical protein
MGIHKPEYNMDKDRKDQIQNAVNRVRDNMTVTKVVATRAVKTKRGDFFVGMSAAWNSVQDDSGGMGSDMDLTMETSDHVSSGMSVIDARIAQHILNKEASVAAWGNALTEGAISFESYEARVNQIKSNTVAHIDRILPEGKDD